MPATPGSTDSATSETLAGAIRRATGLATAFEQGLTPYLKREVGHLEQDLEILEDWAGRMDEEGVDALAGAPVVISTALERVAYFEEQVGEADRGLEQRLEQLDGALAEVEDIAAALDISSTAYVTYVNRSFAARYFDAQVQVGTILSDAGREDVDELGLYPLDDLFGNAIPELAFPANQEVDLREENRVYWESESDGGLIA